MSSRRDRIKQVFQGLIVDPPPVSMRLDLWQRFAESTHSLPADIQGLSVEGVEDYLGFCRAARYRTRVHLEFPGKWTSVRTSGDRTTIQWSLPGGALTKVVHDSEGSEKLAGMRSRVLKYPVESENECKILLDALDQAELRGEFSGFDEFDKRTGNAGLPMLILGECPADFVALTLTGYENFFYALADFPKTLELLIRRIEERFRFDIWPKVLESKSELVLHGTHFSNATTPPPLFRKYHLPYFQVFNSLMHSVGKKVLWHADAEMSLLLQEVLDARFDGADCLATNPLVPQSIEQYHEVWQGRIVCWGGLPGIIFELDYPEAEFRAHVEHLRAFTCGKPGFIIGVSDNLMPCAHWDRVLFVRDTFQCRM